VTPEHGTTQGYNPHRRTGVPACDACKAAKAARERATRATMAAEVKAERTWYAAARFRALTRLGQLFPEVYAVLLREELDK